MTALVLAVLILFGSSSVCAAQPGGKTVRIGYLATGSAGSSAYVVEAFRLGLRELGWLEGQNIAIEFRWAEGRLDQLPRLAAELLRLDIALMVAVATPGAKAAREATAKVPIVMIGVGDPVGLGYVASLGRPGGNITGLSSFSVDLGPKRLELLRDALPRLARVVVMWNPGDPARALEVRDTQAAGERFGLRLTSAEVRSLADIEALFAARTTTRADAIIIQQDPLTLAHRARIAQLALRAGLPAISPFREFPEAGGLMAYGANLVDLYRRAASYVDKILKGAKPADLPVEQPTKFELVINLKTAKALGLTIPQSLLLRADQIIR